MSGHSHFKTIKRVKEAGDKKRGQIFSKLARMISVAVREGGNDPAINSKLRLAIEEARFCNLPKENIERAIKRGAGELVEEKLEEIILEAYGPGGIAIIIEGITDNKNRTLGEIKQILNQNNGKLVSEGAVRWMFKRKGCITINFQPAPHRAEGSGAGFPVPNFQTKENLEMAAIEAGAEDIYWREELLDVYAKPEELEKVKKNLEGREIKIESSSLDWVAEKEIELNEKDKKACQKLFEALDENDAVQNIYSNLKD